MLLKFQELPIVYKHRLYCDSLPDIVKAILYDDALESESYINYTDGDFDYPCSYLKIVELLDIIVEEKFEDIEDFLNSFPPVYSNTSVPFLIHFSH